MKHPANVPIVLIVLLGVFVLSACKPKQQEIEFLKLIPAENINEKITLTIPTELNVNPLYECATILVKNNSHDSMRFPIDYGIKLYVYDDYNQRWDEIINDANYSVSIEGMDTESSAKHIENLGGLLLSPKDEINNSFKFISYCPNFSGYGLPLTVRVVVTGAIDEEGQPKTSIAAYIDVKVAPK